MSAIKLVLLIAALPAASLAAAMCQDDLAVDRQPPFDVAPGMTLNGVSLVASDLRADTSLLVANAEQIVLPFDQPVSVSFVSEKTVSSQALGWLYYDDLIARGYVNVNGTPNDSSDDTLVDSDSDGVADLHADLYNVGFARPYVGVARRCVTTVTAGGRTFYLPDLASQTCSTGTSSEALEADLPPYAVATVDVIGELSPPPAYTASATEFSDNGVHPQIPNLLEPQHSLNGLKGLGHLVFLHTDDDPDNDGYGTGQSFTPAADALTDPDDGIPDYNVTAFDRNGTPLAVPPDTVIDGADRTVNVGLVQGGREVVFFVVRFGDTVHEPTRPLGGGGPRVLPCLVEASPGTCAVYLRTPVTVLFSKSTLNMDFNPLLVSPVVDRDIGCTAPALCGGIPGWLDSATVSRLNSAPYGNLVLPPQVVSIPRPPNNRMPHALLGAPSTNPFQWVLGFESEPGGGERDFNDVVFVIGKSNGGGVVSAVMSGDILPAVANNFTISQIRFEVIDDVTRGLPGPPLWSETVAGACGVAPPPALNYFLSVDCRICTFGVCVPNPTPTWFPVVFPAATPSLAVVNPLELGFIGSQLCWKADLVTPSAQCQPTMSDVVIGYQAEKSGSYSRASVSPIANAVLYGAGETPGSTWIGPPTSPTPAPTIRVYDGKPDVSVRGHLKLTTLYDPEATSVDNVVERWDAGRVFTQVTFDPALRSAFTSDLANARVDLASPFATGELFPLVSACSALTAPYHDLNGDSTCNGGDGDFLAGWLRGWENPTALKKRAWPFGGLNFSTPSFVGPPSQPDWMVFAPVAEQSDYRNNFATPLVDRRAQTYVGTVSGVLHSFDSGLFRLTDDPCTGPTDYRGYFDHSFPGCAPLRDYGSGSESFAYFPRLLLQRFVDNYTGFIAGISGPQATVDASPTVMDVHFGGLGPAWTIGTAPGVGAKSVLVTASGKSSPVVVALDVTNHPAAAPGTYPIPMWELDLGVFANTVFNPLAPPVLIDSLGSRHAPFIGRFEVLTTSGLQFKWLALVGTDFVPSPGYAGTLYLIDLATGQPLNLDTLPSVKSAVIPLEVNWGVAGEPVPIDVDGNGAFDTIYVPSTSGKIWRVSLKEATFTNPPGQEILRCLVGDAQQNLELSGPLAPLGTQRLYSNIAAKVVRGMGPPRVLLFFGTADNPDDPTDLTSSTYYVVSYEDPAPNSAVCGLPLFQWWAQLEPNQRVWGGVSISSDNVFVGTAVGVAADACNLDQVNTGRLYTIPQLRVSGLAAAGVNLGGHATSTPVLYDNHVFVPRANGGPRVLGDNRHNNPPGGSLLPRSRVLTWDSPVDGKLPR